MRILRSLPEFSPGQRIGLFGGSFNPAHAGHRAAALAAFKAAELDWIWWLLALQNPLKDPGETSDFNLRLEKARQIAGHPRFVVTELERDLTTHITAELIERLKPVFARARFVWIMGADSFASLHRWRRWEMLPASLPIIVIDRPGWTFRALASPAARRLSRFRHPGENVACIADYCPPAWAFLTVPLRRESSTAIRAGTVMELPTRSS